MKIDQEELTIILRHLSKLNLAPVNNSTDNDLKRNTIVPDFLLIEENDTLNVELANPKSHSLSLNENYVRSLDERNDKTSDQKHETQYLKAKLASARWFIDAVKERESNMLRIV